MVQIHVGKLILRHLDYGKTGFVVFVPGPCLETEKSVVPSPFSASNVRTTKISVWIRQNFNELSARPTTYPSIDPCVDVYVAFDV